MPEPFARWAAPSLLGAGGCLAAVSVLFSNGSSDGRLVWLGLAAVILATAVAAGVLAGLPRPAPGREAIVALALFVAFVSWSGISIVWSIEPDRSWDYFNRGLVYLAFAAVGLALGAYVPRAPRVWAYALSAAFALALGWALLGKAVPALGSKPQGWFREFTAQPTNPSQTVGPGRLANVSSTSRWQWWKEAWHAFEEQPLRGTGAGTFELTHRLLRSNSIVVTEPHNVPLQFLSETGVLGFLLAIGSVAAAAVGVVGTVRGLDGAERVAAVALGVLALAYLVHSILDFDWDFVAVSGPFFLSVGVLLG